VATLADNRPRRIHEDNADVHDNQAALTLLTNSIASARSKKIDNIYHFAKERVARKEVKVEYCPTAKMIADIMIKAFAEGKFVACCNGMGVQ
jgi:hypothetical protein